MGKRNRELQITTTLDQDEELTATVRQFAVAYGMTTPRPSLSRALIKIFLKTGEHAANLCRVAKIGHGIGNGVVVFQPARAATLIQIRRAGPLCQPEGICD